MELGRLVVIAAPSGNQRRHQQGKAAEGLGTTVHQLPRTIEKKAVTASRAIARPLKGYNTVTTDATLRSVNRTVIIECKYTANHFQARFGKEFNVAMRRHRIVGREQVADIRQNEDYDVVPAAEQILTQRRADLRDEAQGDRVARRGPLLPASLGSQLRP